MHIIAPIGATYLKQRATQLKASSKSLKVESSTGVAPRPPSGDPTAKEFVDPTATVDPLAHSLSDSSLWIMMYSFWLYDESIFYELYILGGDTGFCFFYCFLFHM